MSKKTKFSISLDLDNTLVCSNEDMNAFEKLELYSNPENAILRSRVYTISMLDVADTSGTGCKTFMWGAYRTHLKKFLNFCENYFLHCNVYSAGLPKYVESIVEVLPCSEDFQPTITFNRTDCIMKPDEYGNLITNKPMDKYYSHDIYQNEIKEETTFHVDDLEETFCRDPYNGILIPAYRPSFTKEGILADDDALLKLMAWLSLPEVMNCTDIRTLDKSKIFTTSLQEYELRLSGKDISISSDNMSSKPINNQDNMHPILLKAY